MIAIFLIFLLVVSVFGFFVYKVSKNTEVENNQPQRQIKKIEIKFFALDPNHPIVGKIEKMEALFEFEDDRIIIPIEVEKFKDFEHGGYFREQKWVDGLGYEQVAYNIKTPPITTFWKGGKKIKIEQINLIYKDEDNEVPNIYNIFKEGAKIKLRLSSDLDLKYGGYAKKWVLSERGNWKEEGNDTFTLGVGSDYEIITPTRRVKFNLKK